MVPLAFINFLTNQNKARSHISQELESLTTLAHYYLFGMREECHRTTLQSRSHSIANQVVFFPVGESQVCLYKATATHENKCVEYVGSTANEFKVRYRNHKSSFNNENKKNKAITMMRGKSPRSDVEMT